MVGRLTETGALAKVDDAALYQYCQLFAETEGIRTDTLAIRRLSSQLKQAIQKLNGDALVRAVGEIVKLQALIAKETQQLRQGHMALRQYLVEFGMTPAARPRVKLPKTTAPASKLEAFRHRGSSGAWPPPKP